MSKPTSEVSRRCPVSLVLREGCNHTFIPDMNDVFQKAFGASPDYQDVQFVTPSIEECIQDISICLLALNRDNALAGFAICDPMPAERASESDAISRTSASRQRSLYVAQLAVHPSLWRKGVGRAIMQRAHELARTRGYKTINLLVRHKNRSAKAFYHSLGYSPSEFQLDRYDSSLYGGLSFSMP